jgi:hypothetical protein
MGDHNQSLSGTSHRYKLFDDSHLALTILRRKWFIKDVDGRISNLGAR